ncbi:UMP kinase [Candidatus Woesearchaeota archaeon]|nr:UMP kinase [Candidatus Woesearchaeota archaeon]
MKKVVISLGGSIIVPDKVDYQYLKKFSKLIKKFSKKNKVVIVCGGGKTARQYIDSLKHIVKDDKLLSIVGIAATRLNARLVSGVFDIKHDIPESLNDVKKLLKIHNLVICGALGERANMTSDGNAAEVAALIKADFFVNVTNVDGLYTNDPRTHKDAKFISAISFKDFIIKIDKIKFKAGQHFVLDQSAAKIINGARIKTYIINKNLKNFKKVLKDKKFVGTTIS